MPNRETNPADTKREPRNTGSLFGFETAYNKCAFATDIICSKASVGCLNRLKQPDIVAVPFFLQVISGNEFQSG